MSIKANQAAADKYFKVGRWLVWLAGALTVLFFILIFTGNRWVGLAPCMVSVLVLFHRLWGETLSRSQEVKSLIAERRKRDFWAA